MSPSERDLRPLERGTELWKAVMLREDRSCPLKSGGVLCVDMLHLLMHPGSQGGNGASEDSGMTTREKSYNESGNLDHLAARICRVQLERVKEAYSTWYMPKSKTGGRGDRQAKEARWLILCWLDWLRARCLF